ncbi:DUF6776 family protein [Frateuria defendens]|uniref:DUF6776 family protein n=1 Tax=Frateuria defendens TaxID=2219559 RepID=UPI00066FC4E6|nr:DUF6776 family protein [Frateuria defendens]
MASRRPPPRYVVRPHDDHALRRRRRWLGAAWLGSLLLTALVTGTLAWRTTPAAVDHHELKQLATENDTLKQQVINLQRAEQVNTIATKALRDALAEREAEIGGLRTDLGFYAKLVGGDAQRQGLDVQATQLEPVAGSRGWNLALNLSQNAKRGEEVSGRLRVGVEGMRGNRVEQLDWPALGDAAQKDGLPFRFKYFQQLHATLVLPADFQPLRLHIRAQADGDAALDRVIAWRDAIGDKPTTQGI